MTDDKELKGKAISIKGKPYVQVKDRILYLADNKDYEILTDIIEHDQETGMWVVKATINIYADGETKRSFTGHGQELESDRTSMVNKTSALENAETSAVGRACAMAGIGVIESIASAEEVNKALNRESAPARKPKDPTKTITEKQVKLLWAKAISIDKKKHLNLFVKMHNVERVEDLTMGQMDKVVAWLDAGAPLEPDEPAGDLAVDYLKGKGAGDVAEDMSVEQFAQAIRALSA